MSSTNIPIVFIHIGGAPPDYARVAVRQARLWNPVAPIFFLSSVVEDYGVDETWVALTDIPKGATRKHFEDTTELDSTWRGGFWRVTTERLFILEDWMRSAGVEECLHVENDNMLYAEVAGLVPFLRKGNGLSTPFHSSGGDRLRVCFSVLYCKSVDALANFLFCLASSKVNVDEMIRGGDYWLDTPEECSLLPSTPLGVILRVETYRSWYENPAFPYIFDGAAHGQYLGGEDPRNGSQGPGFVNKDADFRTDQFDYEWRTGENGRYPVIVKDGIWKLANLHIHCKQLTDFVSHPVEPTYTEASYSQAGQDQFVLAVLNKKRGGRFLEIGSSHPIKINNTFLLEKAYGWHGLMVEYERHWALHYRQHRTSDYVIHDATTFDYAAFFAAHNYPKVIDYLQIDLHVSNNSTMKALELLDKTVFPHYTFSVVTFEHDFYTGEGDYTRRHSREIFLRNGYCLVFADVKNGGGPFEDWYVHPSSVDMEYIDRVKSDQSMEWTECLSLVSAAR